MPAKTILVVDDHPDTRVICRELLTHFGYGVLEASSGAQALELAFANLPDLVLLDFLMPESDGLQTLEQMRSHDGMRDKAIVLYTAAATEAEQLRAIEGVQGVLFKPLETSALLKAVRDLIGEP